MSYEKLYQIGFATATLFSFTTYSSNLETIERVYSAKNETKVHTGVLETKTDRKENLQKTIQTIGDNIIPINAPHVIDKSMSKAKYTIKPVQNVEKNNLKITKNILKIASPAKSSSENKIILRNGWNDPRVQHAYDISGGDMDFIKTIEAESKWDVNALGDYGNSFGLCQIHKGYNPSMQKAYRELKTDNEKVKMCYDQYKDWVKRGVIKTRLYGYNARNKPQNKNSFTIK